MQNEDIGVEYGSRSGSDEPLSDSGDRDHGASHDPDGMGGIGMELGGQVIRRSPALSSGICSLVTSNCLVESNVVNM